MQRYFKNSWILSIFIMLIWMQPDPLSTLYASEHSASSAQHPSQAAAQLSNPSVSQAAKPHPEKGTRKLSAFFKVGIALNITMIITFIWWASRQWRMTSKHKDT